MTLVLTSAPVRAVRPSFTANLAGDVEATIGGVATFSRRPGQDGGPAVFDLGLRLLGVQGAVFSA